MLSLVAILRREIDTYLLNIPSHLVFRLPFHVVLVPYAWLMAVDLRVEVLGDDDAVAKT